METPFRRARIPWWCSGDNKAESLVQLNSKCLGLRVRLGSGERVTMPLGQTTFKFGPPGNPGEVCADE